MKDFQKWFDVKEGLDEKSHRPPFVSEGDIWWISFGENVGSEINGKSKVFTRPGVVLKKLAHGFYFVIPTTTQVKEGSWYVPFTQKRKANAACLHQARAVDYRRVFSKLGTIDDADFAKIKEGFTRLYLGI